MQSITFTCETITPMFMAGANPNEPELRAPSIKGALRFWWRAMNGHLGLEDLKKREEEIFGGTEGRSKVELVVRSKKSLEYSYLSFPDKKEQRADTYYSKTRIITDKKTGKSYPKKVYNINILNYLAFGIADFKGNLNRPYILPNTEFTVKLKILDEVLTEEVLTAFIVMSQYGALGSKARNGFGCFQIIEAYKNNEKININQYALPSYASRGLALYTAFSKESKVLFTKEIQGDWAGALAFIGQKYQKARETVEDWHFYDKRKLIAAPIIVGKGPKSTKTDLERHAKPYFLHIAKKDKNTYIASVYCMPYNYLGNTTEGMLKNYKAAIFDFNTKLCK